MSDNITWRVNTMCQKQTVLHDVAASCQSVSIASRADARNAKSDDAYLRNERDEPGGVSVEFSGGRDRGRGTSRQDQTTSLGHSSAHRTARALLRVVFRLRSCVVYCCGKKGESGGIFF